MDRFESLRVFIRVVEAGGFAAAARGLGLSRSVVSRQVIDVEGQLGAALFARTTRRVVPTDTGRAFYQRAIAILADLEEAFAAVAADEAAPRGQLRVNAPMSFGTLHLGAAVAQFMARHPGLKVQLTLSDRLVDPLEEGFDVTLRIAEPVESMSLAVRPVAPARRVLCAAPDYLERHGAPARPADLKGHSCLHYGELATGSFWRFEGPEGPRSVRIEGSLCSNNGEVLRDAALAGLGIALLPTFIVGSALGEGRLRRVMPGYDPGDLMIQLLYPLSRQLSAKVRLFADFLCERFAETAGQTPRG